MTRLSAYRLSAGQAEKALSAWMAGVHADLGRISTDEAAMEALQNGKWDVDRLIDGLGSDGWAEVFESAMLRHFLSYASTSPVLPATSCAHISEILSITDLTQIAYSNHNLPARSISRQFHLHVGPTNSGKTYSALKALSRAGTGVYAGPLRLLAHEVWERLNLGSVGDLNGQGRECNLLTGEERRIVSEDAGLVSCTVEMIPTTAVGGEPWDVVVIDEIQMLGDAQRGGAWTNALLGVKAREVHLCGDETTVALLSALIPTLGDTVTVHRYNRLTPLQVADTSLEGDWNKIQKGDCVVTFSRTNIFSVKKQIESIAGKKCAVVYGALPPETRAEQAKDFNEGRAEVLVASDAVGMGLNL
jgi:ATP-dependent RNA helicase SUPV3L1/SUV3